MWGWFLAGAPGTEGKEAQIDPRHGLIREAHSGPAENGKNVRMLLPAGLGAGFGQCLEKILVIDMVERNGLAPVSVGHEAVPGAGVSTRS